MERPTYDVSRRRFMKNGLLAAGLLPIAGAELFAAPQSQNKTPLQVHIFSKHLQFLNFDEVAEAAASMGFDGVDLTVRPKGHVLPHRVKDDLPRAAEAIRRHGLKPTIITTAVDDAQDPEDIAVLETAAALNFTNYRMNWLPYEEKQPMPVTLQQHAERIKALTAVNKRLKLPGCYQNHAGELVGASLWEIHHLLQGADPQFMGVEYDIRHAMVEGATSWENGLRLVSERINWLTLKDYRWAKVNGKWMVEDVPIGQGMVDFKRYFGLLRKYNVNVPATLHIEYPLGGVEHGATNITINKQEVFASMKKDLQMIKQLWIES